MHLHHHSSCVGEVGHGVVELSALKFRKRGVGEWHNTKHPNANHLHMVVAFPGFPC